MPILNRQILLASRPEGDARVDNFRLVEVPIGDPAEGQVLVRTRFRALAQGREAIAAGQCAPE